MTKILTVDEAWELKKGMARGGTYHRRVRQEDGGHRYYYDKAKYERDHEHVDGAEAAGEHLRSSLKRSLHEAGDAGVALHELKPHVRRHGPETVAKALEELGAEHREGRVYRKAGPKLVLTKAEAQRTPKPPKTPVPTLPPSQDLPVGAPAQTKRPTPDADLSKAIMLKPRDLRPWRPLCFRGGGRAA